jgi:hypothetical protein
MDADGVHIAGWHSHDDLDFVAQVAAIADPGIRARLLSSREY